MTGRNPDGIEDFPSPGCSDVAHGPQRLNAIIGAYEAFLDPVCGTDDLSFHLVLELPATETPSARRCTLTRPASGGDPGWACRAHTGPAQLVRSLGLTRVRCEHRASTLSQ